MTRRLIACLLAAFVLGALAAALLLSASDPGPQPWPVGRTSVPFEPPVLATPWVEVRG